MYPVLWSYSEKLSKLVQNMFSNIAKLNFFCYMFQLVLLHIKSIQWFFEPIPGFLSYDL